MKEVLVLLGDTAAKDDHLGREERLDVGEILVDSLRPLLPIPISLLASTIGRALLRVLAANDQVSELGVGEQLSASEYCAADAGAEREDHDCASVTATGSERHLADTSCVSIVEEHNGAASRLLEQLLAVCADPALIDVCGRVGDPLLDYRGKGTADQPVPLELASDLTDDFGDGVRRGRLRRRDPVAFGHQITGLDVDRSALDA